MLDDRLEATLEHGRMSSRQLSGWIYSQVYNSVKEVFDAVKVKLLQVGLLEKLTWDLEVCTATLVTRKLAKSSYLERKNRLAHTLQDVVWFSYGVYEEHPNRDLFTLVR